MVHEDLSRKGLLFRLTKREGEVKKTQKAKKIHGREGRQDKHFEKQGEV